MSAVREVAPPGERELALAAEAVAATLAPTPLLPSPELGPDALVKLEVLQPTGSFKVRGGVAAAAGARPGERLVTASAGNHGLGLAWAAVRRGVELTVVVPTSVSPAKLAGLRALGVEPVRHGDDYDAAEGHALALALDGVRYVSPYNDPLVIAGAATLGTELLAQAGDAPMTVVVPVGGGGLAAGVGLALRGRAGVRVVGVVAAASPAMRAALDAGEIVPIEVGETLADGLAGGLEPGSVTVALARDLLHDVVAVSEAEIRGAMRFLAGAHGLVAEGAGAVAAAALLADRVPVAGRPVALVTGRNVALATLAAVLAGG